MVLALVLLVVASGSGVVWALMLLFVVKGVVVGRGVVRWGLAVRVVVFVLSPGTLSAGGDCRRFGRVIYHNNKIYKMWWSCGPGGSQSSGTGRGNDLVCDGRRLPLLRAGNW